MKLKLSYIVLLCFGLFLLSCEKEKTDLIDVSLNSPFVSSLQLGTSSVNLDTTAAPTVVHLPDSSYRIRDTVFARIVSSAGAQDIQEVSYYLYRPEDQNSFVSGSLQFIETTDSTATYRAAFSFNVQRCDIGAYRVEVIARTQSGLMSNSLVKSVIVGRNNLPPRLSNLSAPDTLHRPVSGTRPVFFAVSATDPDCESDIVKVFFRSINSHSPNFEFRLYDDGNLAVTGDSVAGNGRYSLVIPIDSTATLGRLEFRFWARDKSGALSDSLAHFITILPSPE